MGYSQRIVEANPRKFNLDATELGVRKAFITSTRQVVRVRPLSRHFDNAECIEVCYNAE